MRSPADRAACWRAVYAELAAKFQPLVDALGEISDAARTYTQADVLRLYEIWLRTGSARARGLLAQLGVAAAPVTLQRPLACAAWWCKSCKACSSASTTCRSRTTWRNFC